MLMLRGHRPEAGGIKANTSIQLVFEVWRFTGAWMLVLGALSIVFLLIYRTDNRFTGDGR